MPILKQHCLKIGAKSQFDYSNGFLHGGRDDSEKKRLDLLVVGVLSATPGMPWKLYGACAASTNEFS